MKYIDLPFAYRDYAERNGWEEKQALAYWQQSAEFRAFVNRELLNRMGTEIAKEEPSYPRVSIYNSILKAVRGARAKLS